jgi:hypothetical protein
MKKSLLIISSLMTALHCADTPSLSPHPTPPHYVPSEAIPINQRNRSSSASFPHHQFGQPPTIPLATAPSSWPGHHGSYYPSQYDGAHEMHKPMSPTLPPHVDVQQAEIAFYQVQQMHSEILAVLGKKIEEGRNEIDIARLALITSPIKKYAKRKSSLVGKLKDVATSHEAKQQKRLKGSEKELAELSRQQFEATEKAAKKLRAATALMQLHLASDTFTKIKQLGGEDASEA